jgi:hypothetical protein
MSLVPTWFLYLAGFSLALLGILQIQARPHERGAGLYERFVNVGTLWSLCCITVGVGFLLMALGYYTPSFLQATAPPAHHHHLR